MPILNDDEVLGLNHPSVEYVRWILKIGRSRKVLDAVLKAVVKPHFTTDQHQDERRAIVPDVRKRTLEHAGQSA